MMNGDARLTSARKLSVAMFTTQERDRARNEVLEWASADPRVVAGAVVGSLAHDPGDRFSDLDLTFGVRDEYPISEVLEDWSQRLIAGFEAVQLFDLSAGSALYRVLLPGCLQLDLSFAPASDFGAIGSQFRLLFGTAVSKPSPPSPDPRVLFGYGVHHAVRARVCVERTRYWQAEYWTSALRDHALTMACLRLGLPGHYGKGFDSLPDEIRTLAAGAVVSAVSRLELLEALRHGTDLLLAEGAVAGVCQSRLSERLLDFISMPAPL